MRRSSAKTFPRLRLVGHDSAFPQERLVLKFSSLLGPRLTALCQLQPSAPSPRGDVITRRSALDLQIIRSIQHNWRDAAAWLGFSHMCECGDCRSASTKSTSSSTWGKRLWPTQTILRPHHGTRSVSQATSCRCQEVQIVLLPSLVDQLQRPVWLSLATEVELPPSWPCAGICSMKFCACSVVIAMSSHTRHSRKSSSSPSTRPKTVWASPERTRKVTRALQLRYHGK